MKKIVLLPIFIALVHSCKKIDPIPSIYYGTWITETPQFLSTNYRIHTLKIYTDSKGRPYGEYTSTGQYELFNESVDGFVVIEGNLLKVRTKEFTIEQVPYENELGELEMKLSTLEFKKS